MDDRIEDARPGSRVIALGLDGYDPDFADRLVAEGHLPNLERLIAESARWPVDQGEARYTGLTWQHVSTGMTPEALRVWSATLFDPRTYRVAQPTTRAAPFPAALEARTVVFDAPYFALDRAPEVRGLVGWGAHDPGVPETSNPQGLTAEVKARFGAYEAAEHIYGFTWPSAARTAEAAQRLVAALDQRAEIAAWLLAERLPDWDLAYLVVGELHSAVEPFFHGVDPGHPLHGLPSAGPARDGLRGVYAALDRMIGRLRAAHPDAVLVTFCSHGMGRNNADVVSMAVLPEIMYRRSFGRGLLEPRADWSLEGLRAGRLPMLGEEEGWTEAVCGQLAFPSAMRLERAARIKLAKARKRVFGLPPETRPDDETMPADTSPLWRRLDWMPSALYRPFWPRMEAFAMPSFYDGRIRINLKGREAKGVVEPSDYAATLERLARFVEGLRDPVTGEPAARAVKAVRADAPMEIHPTQADLVILWGDTDLLALEHAEAGIAGPVPWRRPGGHTGGDGICMVAGGPAAPGVHGRIRGAEVVPMIRSLLGEGAASGALASAR